MKEQSHRMQLQWMVLARWCLCRVRKASYSGRHRMTDMLKEVDFEIELIRRSVKVAKELRKSRT